VELANDDPVRVRTKGDGPFVETVTCLDTAASSTVCNYSGGEQVGSNWTDKIMAMKSVVGGAEDSNVSREEGEAAADDEWDD